MANKKVSQQLLTLEHRLERQSDTIKNIQENVDNTSKYQDLRQDVLKSQGSLINRWLNVIGIFLSVIMVLSAYGVFVVEDKIKDLDKLVKESESVLGVIKKNKELSDKYTKESLNPESTLTEKIKQEVKESGTELQKLMLKIRKEKDLKIAIDLWKYVIGRAYYEDDKKSIFIGYFNLGYSYGKEGYHKKAIGAYKKFIEIKPDDHKAYHNMGIAYYKLKEYQAAIDAFEKAIKIKPDAYENYNSVGAAYIKLFESQLIQTQDFDQDLVRKFNMYDNIDKEIKALVKVLTIFKSIDNGTQVAGWQQVFNQKYQGVFNQKYQGVRNNIEKWIDSKPNDEKKQALQSALEFFKAQ